jgi:toxin ParE1/3/4
MARVLRTPSAEHSLLQIARHIASESQSLRIAFRFLDRIEEKCALVATQPLSGTARPGLGPRVRCFPVQSYVVLYEPLDDGILLLLAAHGARDIPAVFRAVYGERDSSA